MCNRRPYPIIPYFLLIIFLLASCRQKNNQVLSDEYIRLVGTRVSYNCQGLIKLSQHYKGRQNKLCGKKSVYISYHDSTECSPCLFSESGDWEIVMNEFKKKGIYLQPILIIEPSKKKIKHVEQLYYLSKCKLDVYIDTAGVFLKSNPRLPKDNKMRSFLLDKQSKVIFIGDPIKNSLVMQNLLEGLDSLCKYAK